MRWLTALKSDPDLWKAGLRTATAAAAAYGLATYLALPQGYWSVVTAIMIMQASVGASIEAAFDRWLGTLAGAALGLPFAVITPSSPIGTVAALVLSCGPLAMLAAKNSSFRIAPMTAAILLISAPSHVVALTSALHRVIEITLGCCVGLAVSLLVAPSRADIGLRAEAGRMIGLLAGLVTLDRAAGEGDDQAFVELGTAIDNASRSIDSLAKEARAEHVSRLAQGGIDPNRLRQGLRELRVSVFALRHVTHMFQSRLSGSIGLAAKAVTDATRDYLLALAAAVSDGTPAPQLGDIDAALAAFNAAAGQPAAEGPDRDFIPTFSFALRDLRSALAEVLDCLAGT